MKQKITDILKWFANLGNIAKTIVAVVSLGGIIIGGIKLYNATVIAKHDKEVHEVARDTTINAVLIKINNLSTQVNDISRGAGRNIKEPNTNEPIPPARVGFSECYKKTTWQSYIKNSDKG